MSVWEVISLLTIKPLELLFEAIYAVADGIANNPGVSIALLSLVVNLLVLPLYARADKIQAEEADKQKQMEHWIKHIKKTFKKEERLMMLQTYYRQNNYKPYSSLLQSVPLLLQVPFFIAAYHFLSTLDLLKNTPLGPIADLGAPDAIFTIGNFPINILPILMTLINILSGMIYTKKQPLKMKLQIYGMALLFMVLLYNSPSGLVFYWTCNNIFSLFKNIITKIIEKDKASKVDDETESSNANSDDNFSSNDEPKHNSIKSQKWLFFAGGLFLSILAGIYIPTNVIKSSTSEFVNIVNAQNPLTIVVYSALMSLGTFVIWAGIFYLLAKEKVRIVFECAIWCLCGIATLNYLIVGKSLGQASSLLAYAEGPVFGRKLIAVSILASLIIITAVTVISIKKQSILRAVAIAAVLSITVLSFINCIKINKDYKKLDYIKGLADAPQANLKLSKNGKNVVVIMIDRAIGSEVPYLFDTNPKLKEQFDGFTYYKNTVSFGAYTNFATPSLYGGYEYTPEKLNNRSDESLVTKHNEALKVLPVLFEENGYNVTVCDPPYANYNWIPDVSIFDDYDNINAYITVGKINYGAPEDSASYETLWHRIFFCHSLMKMAPLFLQDAIYQHGLYDAMVYRIQAQGDPRYTRAGYHLSFMENYLVLKNLSRITTVEDNDSDTFLCLTNGTTHETTLLQEPDYEPQKYIDNTSFHTGEEHYVVDGVEINMNEPKQVLHFHVNMAAFMQLGNWFDYLRENECYDNTRIIIVSDHGRDVNHLGLIKDDVDMEFFMPVLLVKDFNAIGLKTSEEFMTNADTPALAVEGIIKNPVNPFTGNVLDGHEKTEEEIRILYSEDWSTDINNGNRFLPGQWFSVSKSPYKLENWRYLKTE